MNAPPPGRPLDHALALQRQGKLKQAVAAYKSLVKRDPGNFDAHYFCAMALLQEGKPAEANRALDRALKLSPRHADALVARGNVLMTLGRKDQALKSFQAAQEADPDHGGAAYAHGNALVDCRRLSEARDSFERAVQLMPEWPEAHLALANTLAEMGAGDEALDALDVASARGAQPIDVHYIRANALKGMERHDDAIASYRAALAIHPDFAEALNNLGISLAALDRHDEALAHYQSALALLPNSTLVINNLGKAYQKLRRHDEALAQYRAALAIDPKDADAHYNIGLARTEAGDHEGAIRSYRRALAADPGMAKAANDLSHELLARHQFKEGWNLYQARFEAVENMARTQDILGFDMPVGNASEDISGKKLLIRGEQGLGDEIMYASMMSEIIETADHVTFAVEPRLVGLMERSFPGCQVIAYRSEEQHRYADFDVDRRFYLASLAKMLRTQAADFPGVPYLTADPGRRAAMRARLDALGAGRKIGVMWQGGVGKRSEFARSVDLATFAPILAKGVHWISLNHLPEAGTDCAHVSAATGARIHHWDDILRSDDYDDTAALLSELDAVVSVTCTAAHCSAALGTDTHVLVNRDPIWRYAGDSGDILWYKAMTLYRQREDWPIEAIGRELGIHADPPAD